MPNTFIGEPQPSRAEDSLFKADALEEKRLVVDLQDGHQENQQHEADPSHHWGSAPTWHYLARGVAG